MRRACLALVLFAFACGSGACLNAQVTIVQRAGPQTSDYVIVDHGQTLGVTWTQNGVFAGVAIFATISLGPDAGFAYLTNQIGPGTTAANEIASAPFTFPATAIETLLLTGLTLGPGTYYLTLTATNGGSAGWWGTNAQTVTTAPGATLSSDYDTFTPATYPPATNFNTTATTNLLFKVTGTPVPEPSTLAALLTGIGLIAVGRFKRSLQGCGRVLAR
jgi:hypothetical protein